MGAEGLIDKFIDIAGKVWNLPNTLLGLAHGLAGYAVGNVMYALGLTNYRPTISVGNNAIIFRNNPLVAKGSGIGLGNTISLAPGVDGTKVNDGAYSDVSTQMGAHEEMHTIQGQRLGPLFIPAWIAGGGSSSINPLEREADSYGADYKNWW